MKIAIPVNENDVKTTVCPSFGRTPYFLIYNTETRESSFLNNSAAASQGGAGILAAQTLVDQNVESVLTPRCGKNAADVLQAAQVKLYRTMNDSIEDNLTAFQAKALSPLAEIHPGFHNHGGK